MWILWISNPNSALTAKPFVHLFSYLNSFPSDMKFAISLPKFLAHFISHDWILDRAFDYSIINLNSFQVPCIYNLTFSHDFTEYKYHDMLEYTFIFKSNPQWADSSTMIRARWVSSYVHHCYAWTGANFTSVIFFK